MKMMKTISLSKKICFLIFFTLPLISAAARGNFEDIAGKTWKLTGVEPGFENRPAFNRAELEAEAFTLAFETEEKRVSGRAFPNRFSGPYETEGVIISIGALVSTKMAALGEPESLTEQEFFNLLSSAGSWELKEGRLVLHIMKEGKRRDLVFESE
jgi:hypothetical protein